ncbi:hypothetical protein CHLRE_04g217954v5 [Chlamydomonas reinhardtii]|uniref:Cation-transporting P-type ATPase N-terminal domain-containing protein n=1 Tax=Chlamydomonas reinhardtii TaxID=3055 RepID=A0A2K3DTK4_CHLRE|nr:uncharacterized protein CHLRE_04g217954v5 [Chlamydomonas reinhardtii]PNW83854.1 hypothetical protein CHLRE_04g217954v5 [Chlamydomonas reinhardtii]
MSTAVASTTATTAQRRSLQLRASALGGKLPCAKPPSCLSLRPLQPRSWTGQAAVPAPLLMAASRAQAHVLPRLGSRWRPIQLSVPCSRASSCTRSSYGSAACGPVARGPLETPGLGRASWAPVAARDWPASRLSASLAAAPTKFCTGLSPVACCCAAGGGGGAGAGTGPSAVSEDTPAGSSRKPRGLMSRSTAATVDLDQLDEGQPDYNAGPTAVVATASAGSGSSTAPAAVAAAVAPAASNPVGGASTVAVQAAGSGGWWLPGSPVVAGASGSSMDVAAAAGGFGISVGDLARLVSYAFDHDGCLPPCVTAAALTAALRTAVPGITASPTAPATATTTTPPSASGAATTATTAVSPAPAAAVAAAGIPDPAVDPADAAARAAAFGVNSLPPAHEVTFWELVAEALEDFTVQALLAAGLLSLGLSSLEGPAAGSADWVEGVAILGTVALVVAVGAGTGYAKEAKFRQLNALKDDVQVRVIRGGGPPTPLPARQLLVGDLLLVEAGDILQADGLLVAGDEIRLDQSHLTGESDDVIRCAEPLDSAGGAAAGSMMQRYSGGATPPAAPAAPAASIVLSGSKVLDGYGRMVVLAVGPYSQQGSINTMMRGAAATAAGVRVPPPAVAPAGGAASAGSASASVDERPAAPLPAVATTSAHGPSRGASGSSGGPAMTATASAAVPAAAADAPPQRSGAEAALASTAAGFQPAAPQAAPAEPSTTHPGSSGTSTHGSSRSSSGNAAHADAASRSKRKRTTQGARRGRQLVKLGGVAASGAFAAASSVLASVTSLASFDGDLPPGSGDAAAREAAEAEAAVKAAAAEAADKAAAANRAASGGGDGAGGADPVPLLLSNGPLGPEAPAAVVPAPAPGSRGPRDRTPLGTMGTMGSVDFPMLGSTPLSTPGSGTAATTTGTTVTTTMDQVAAPAAAAATAAAGAGVDATAGGRLRAAARALVAGPPTTGDQAAAGTQAQAAAAGVPAEDGSITTAAAAAATASAAAASVMSDSEGSGLRGETFLMQKLQGLAQAIGAFGVAAAGAVFAVNAAALTGELLTAAGAVAGGGPPLPEAVDIAKSYLDLVITSITILVVAVPEGLPLAVTLALAFSVQRMLADNNLVRQLGACETMGAATTICSDKTGTLTSNNMTVVRLWTAGRHFGVKPLQPQQQLLPAAATPSGAVASTTGASVGGGDGGVGNSATTRTPVAPFDRVPSSSGGTGATGSLSAGGMASSWRTATASTTTSATATAVAAAAATAGRVAAQLVPLPAMEDSQASLTSGSDVEAAAGSAAGSSKGVPGMRGRVVEREETLLAALAAVADAEAEALAAISGSSSSDAVGVLSAPATAGGGGGGAATAGQQLLPGRIRDLLVQGLVLNSTACLKPNPTTGGFDRSGSPTECALLELPHRLGWGWGWGHGGSSTSTAAVVAAPAAPAAASAESAAGAAAAGVGHCGGDTAAARDSGVACSTSKSSSNAGTHILQLVPFSSARKRMSVVVDGPCQAGLGQLPAFFGDSYPPHSRTLSSSIGTMQSVDMEDARSGGPGDSSIGSSSGTANSSSARVGSVRASDEDGGTSAALEISASSSNGSSSSAGAGPPLSPVRVLTKGAAELVLERCSWVLLPRGEGQDGGGGGEVAGDTEVRPLSAEQKQRLLASFRGRGGGALRLLALAYRDMLVPLQPPPTAAAAAASAPSVAAPATADQARAAGGSRSSSQGVVGGAASMGGRSEMGAAGRGAGSSEGAGEAAATAAAAAKATAVPIDTRSLKLDPEYLEKDLVLVGLVGLQDPLRPEVPGAVAACTRAGITVRMVTGDNATTAACIAQQAGILPPAADPAHLVVRGAATAASLVAAATSATASPAPTSSTSAYFTAPTTPLVLEGATFRQLVTSPDYPGARLPILGGGGGAGGGGGPGGGGVAPPAVNREAFLALWPRLRVLARCSPGDKFMLVTAVRQLREQGALEEVVAVTGDGTNDAPALTAADVGFCMASGTPIAKEAADILLLDSSFAPIVAAVAWGRNVYASVTRFLQFQLTANVVAVAVAVGGAVWLGTSPLSAVQMLWVNLIMDSLASLALATEAPTASMLTDPPNRPNDPLITPIVMKHVVGQAAFQLAALYGILVALQHYSSYGAADLEAAYGAGGLQAAAAALFATGAHAGAAAAAAAGGAAQAAGAAAAATAATAGGVVGGGLVPADTTLVFNAFVCMQLFNQVNCRRVRDEADVTEGLAAHPLFLGIVGAEAGLQAAIVQWGGDAFSTSPLSPAQWGLCLGLGAGVMAVREGLRRVKL